MSNNYSFDIDRIIVTLPILILLFLSAFFLIKRANKPKEKRKNIIFSLLPGILAVVYVVAFGIAFYSAWQDDVDALRESRKQYEISIDIPDSETKIVIMEERPFGDNDLLRAEFYLEQNGDRKYGGEIFDHKSSWRPFINGQYEIVEVDSNHFTICWAPNKDVSKSKWERKTFAIINSDP